MTKFKSQWYGDEVESVGYYNCLHVHRYSQKKKNQLIFLPWYAWFYQNIQDEQVGC